MSEFRKDIVTEQWVIIASERGKRPSDYSVIIEKNKQKVCPFCTGFENLTPAPVYTINIPGSNSWQVRVVPNKYPALQEIGDSAISKEGFYHFMQGSGKHEVIIETGKHSERMVDFSKEHLENVLRAYKDRHSELQKNKSLKYILIFKNHGREAGATLEHSHSQLIATPIVPISVKNKVEGAKRFFSKQKKCVFCEILAFELEEEKRVILENDEFVSYSPYASRVPFEICIVPKKHQDDYSLIDDGQIVKLADILKQTLVYFDNALNYPPFNLILHTAPLHENSMGYYHWHIEIMPKLTTLAGFELGSGFFINPTPPEEAAHFLRQKAV